ncbi:TonB-dependent receptor [Sphingomonas sp. TX0543]|uniref:TonB-dependent receptor n=1 Tax=Sphingomonas sp. TX0543 TaxID=3399682 RepID=UPI003AFA5855
MVFLACPNVVHAQDASTSPSAAKPPAVEPQATTPDADSGQIQDIVVTAQRRSESALKVPISIQVLSGQALSQQQVIDTRDLARFTPTVNFAYSSGAMVSTFGLRGVSSKATAPGVQPSVGLVVDGIPVYNQAEFITGLGDIERVEVLNGPQGTLFGKNSTAGVISVVTKNPTADLAGEFQASQTSDNETYLRGMINIPLSEGIRLRVNGFYQNLSPQVKNLTGNDVFGLRAYGVQAKLAVDLTPNATFILSGAYNFNKGNQNQYTIVGKSSLNAAAAAAGVFIPTGEGGTVVNTNSPAADVYSTKTVRGTLNWTVSDALTITSISNYTDFSDKYYIDGDGTPFGSILGIGESIPGATYPFQGQYIGYGYRQRTKYFSEELRGNLKLGPADIVVGGFYQHVKLQFNQYTPYKFAGAFSPPAGAPAISADRIASHYTNTTAAVFADATIALAPAFKIFGGARYTNETLNQVYHRDTYFAPYSTFNPVTGVISAAPSTIVDLTGKRRIGNLSGRAGAQYQPTSNINFYGSFSRGYKGPAANNNTGLAPGQNVTLEPEIATAYEIGVKLRLLDNRLVINVAAFSETVKNLQVSAIDPTRVGVVTILKNAGRELTKGVEGDITVMPARGLQLGFSGAYNDATYGGFILPCNTIQVGTGTCPNFNGQTGVQNGDGLRAIFAPKFRFTVSANYQSDIAGTKLRFFSGGDYAHTSSSYANADNNPLTLLIPHGTLNGSIGLKTADGRWQIELFGKNLLDKFYYTSRVAVASVGLPAGYLPRDFHAYGGISLTSRF